MIIWKKSKEVVLDCFTVEDSVAEHFPIRETTYFKSRVIKNIPKRKEKKTRSEEYATLASASVAPRLNHPDYCIGFNDLMKYGFVLPWWTETFLHGDLINGEYKINFDASHPHNAFLFQYGLNSEEYAEYQKKVDSVVVRIECPWRIKANDKTFFLHTNSWVYNMKNTFMPLNGVLEFWWNNTANAVVGITKQNNLRHHFNPGEPLIQFIPLEKVNLKIKIHIVDEKTFFSDIGSNKFFYNKLQKLRRWSLKK